MLAAGIPAMVEHLGDDDAAITGTVALAGGIVALVCTYYSVPAITRLTTGRRIGVPLASTILFFLAFYSLGGIVVVAAIVLAVRPRLRRRIAGYVERIGGWRALLSGPVAVTAGVAIGVGVVTPIGFVIAIAFLAALTCTGIWAIKGAAVRTSLTEAAGSY